MDNAEAKKLDKAIKFLIVIFVGLVVLNLVAGVIYRHIMESNKMTVASSFDNNDGEDTNEAIAGSIKTDYETYDNSVNDTEHIVDSDEPINEIFDGSEELTYEDDERLYLSENEIENERLRIKGLIDTGLASAIKGEHNDVIKWDWTAYYEEGSLIFVYYYNSIDGQPDQRFYFKDGRMIRWIIGTSPDQVTYQISDEILPEDWSVVEANCLQNHR